MSIDTQYAVCDFNEVRDFITLNHYSRSCPKGGLVSHSFSARVRGLLVGAAVFGHKAGNAKTGSIFRPPYDTSEYSRELIRLVLSDVMPPNSESEFIGWCLKTLRYNTDLRGLLSYADPEHDHVGTIYQATNWGYTGPSNPSKRLIVDGFEMHRRRASNLFGTCSVPAIRAAGHTVESRTAKPKYRYVYVLQEEMIPFLKYQILPYPKCVDDNRLTERKRAA